MKKAIGIIILGFFINTSSAYSGCKDDLDFSFNANIPSFYFGFQNNSGKWISITRLRILKNDNKTTVWFNKNPLLIIHPYQYDGKGYTIKLNHNLKPLYATYSCEYSVKEPKIDLKKLKKLKQKPWWKVW